MSSKCFIVFKALSVNYGIVFFPSITYLWSNPWHRLQLQSAAVQWKDTKKKYSEEKILDSGLLIFPFLPAQLSQHKQRSGR